MADVLNRTTLELLLSVNTPDYPVEDWVINPDLSAVAGVPQKYWKLTGDVVSEMTQPEKDAVDAAEIVFAPNHLQEKFDRRGRLLEKTYFAKRDVTTDALSVPYTQTTYTWSDFTLISETTERYDIDGAVVTTETQEYFAETVGDDKFVRRKMA